MMMKMNSLSLSVALLLSTSALVGCGGSNNSNSADMGTPATDQGNNDPLVWAAGSFPSSDLFKHQCVTPRTGIDPYENKPYPDTQGSEQHEKMWVRSFNNETYLWYDQVADKDPQHPDFEGDEDLDTVAKYFLQLKAEGDRFHYFESYDDYKKEAESGVVSGYGVRWAFINSRLENGPRVLRVAFTQNNSPAAKAGLQRGDTITAINDEDISSTNTTPLNAGLQPQPGETHTFTVAREGITDPITFELTAGDVASTPVQNVKVLDVADKKVGYVQFNQFIAVGQQALINAFDKFSTQQVDDLVIDMRYNGGGLVVMSAQLGYMIAGEGPTQASQHNNAAKSQDNPAKVFSRIIHNDKVEAQKNKEDYYTFERRQIDWTAEVYTNTVLPSLNLDTVYILASASTCSASESLINGLRGVGVNVVLIGGQTCGKPYGFNPAPNCGRVYYTVQFKGANAKEFGDYADGFKPVPESEATQSTIGLTANVPGCIVADDFTSSLGDENEEMLATALTHIETGNCPANKDAAQNVPALASPQFSSVSDLVQPQHPMRHGLVDIKIKESNQ